MKYCVRLLQQTLRISLLLFNFCLEDNIYCFFLYFRKLADMNPDVVKASSKTETAQTTKPKIPSKNVKKYTILISFNNVSPLMN